MPLVRALLFVLSVAIATTSALSAAESAGGMSWTMPAGWKTMPDRPMRAASYVVSPIAPDTAASDCVVYFFGRGQGGSVADNIERWRNQVLGPDGKTAPAKVDKRQNGGLTTDNISVGGEVEDYLLRLYGGRPPVPANDSYTVFEDNTLTTTDVTGAIGLPDGAEMIMPGDNVDMSVELITPIALEVGQRFAIREGGRTVGAGAIVSIQE